MKLQDLVLIFLIIIIPLILIFSYYINLESDTLKLQIDYDKKLNAATKEAVQAFEINTTEWNNDYQTLANVKKRELKDATNVFINGLSSKIGIAGTAKENILNYIPAVVYTMYDGYYIYSPTYVPISIVDEDGLQIFYYKDADEDKGEKTFSILPTQSIKKKSSENPNIYISETYAGVPIFEATYGNGISATYKYQDKDKNEKTKDIYYTTDRSKAKKEYKHVLKTFVPYSEQKGDVTVNYTLDNYVRVWKKTGDVIESNEGYIEESITVHPSTIDGIIYNGVSIESEILTETVRIKIDETDYKLQSVNYFYSANGDKVYYDNGVAFSIDKEFNKKYYEKVDDVNDPYKSIIFKKLLIITDNSDSVEVYQVVNPRPLPRKMV